MEKLDRKTFAAGVLSVTALVLLVAQFLPISPAPAVAGESVKERDFIAVTARMSAGGEGLYITDNRTGKMAVFTWDTSARTLVLAAQRDVADAFNAQKSTGTGNRAGGK